MKISVVIPLYNKKNTIKRALDSVQAQTVKPEEIIVVNDGSSDGSEKIVYGYNHNLIRLINQKNEGVSAARNRGIAEAKGDWIAFLDADDEWLPDFLFNIKLLFEKYSDSNVAATSYFIQNNKGICKKINLNKLSFIGEEGILSNYFEVAAFSYPPVWSSAVVIKKQALLDIGCFPIGVISGEDLITWAKLAFNYNIAYRNTPLAIFHLNKTHELDTKPIRKYNNGDFVGNELLSMLTKSNGILRNNIKKYISHWYKMRTSVSLRDDNLKEVWEFGLKSIKYNPKNFKVFTLLMLSIFPNKIKRYVFQKRGL
jgi:glycosyltransferase involved in cell wall biosynthesis